MQDFVMERGSFDGGPLLCMTGSYKKFLLVKLSPLYIPKWIKRISPWKQDFSVSLRKYSIYICETILYILKTGGGGFDSAQFGSINAHVRLPSHFIGLKQP